MSKNQLDKYLIDLNRILAWIITFLCSILGIMFISLAQGDKLGYSYGAIFIATAITVAPTNKFPGWAKVLIAGIMVFLIL